MSPRISFLTLLALTTCLHAAEFYVATTGDDSHSGARKSPFRTIQHAADVAQPGDFITVHQGVYRERINPPRGGISDKKRIVYQAARGEKVEIKGSEIVKSWTRVQDGVWQATVPNSFFGNFNPCTNLIHGDWFWANKREHHTGAVYLNGQWLVEAAKFEDVMKPPGKMALWFGKVDATNTTIWAQFNGVDPNEQLVEINVRQTVFYPDKPGRNYITVRGFTMRDAATPWAPPTAEQIGLIGTHWSKGWIIEDNIISHSVCCGVSLGKHGDEYDNTSANTAEGYVKTIERAHAFAIPWTKENIGHHIVRNNSISHCEQAGIVGSLGAAFSTVTGNDIHDIHVRCLFGGAEMAGIKFHGAVDTVICSNHIYRTCRGLWLDWMAQGTRVSRNLFHDNTTDDLLMEVDHGPFVVDNNIFLSATSIVDMSEDGAYVHNLFAGYIRNRPEPDRQIPYHAPHSTAITGLTTIKGGEDRFYNNIFIGKGEKLTPERKGDLKELRWISSDGLWGYDGREFALQTGGNVYYNEAVPCSNETGALILQNNPAAKLIARDDHYFLQLTFGKRLREVITKPVTTASLGIARVTGLRYENADGSMVRIDSDFFGKKRSRSKPTAGPFENPNFDELNVKVW